MKPDNRFYVYFVPKTHHDLGYTHTIDDLLDAYCSYYDDVLDFCDRTSSYPTEAQYRYTVESFWSLDYYLKHTSDKKRERMKQYVRSGRIEIQAFYANVIDGICSEEEIARLTYRAVSYAKKCGSSVRSAALTDIPGMSNGLIKALSGADIPYLFVGFPTYFEWGDADKNPLPKTRSFWDEEGLFGRKPPFAFNWCANGGGKVFSFYQYGYGYMGKDSDPLFEADNEELLEEYLPKYVEELKTNTPYSVMRYVDHGMDNVQPSDALCDVVARWNETHDDIKCIVATESMFFDALYECCGKMQIPEIHGEMPHTDYTVYAFSESEMTALNARTKEKLKAIEHFYTLINGSQDSAEFQRGADQIYSDVMLYDEHCFGMGKPGYKNEYNRSQKNSYALRAAWKTDDLRKNLFPSQGFHEAEGYTLFDGSGVKGIGKICSWLQYEDRKAQSDKKSFTLTDELGNTLFIQRDTVNDPSLPIPELAEKYALKKPSAVLNQYTLYAPPQGENISTLPLKNASMIPLSYDKKYASSILENRYYRIEFSSEPGGILRIFDKELKKELVDEGCVFGEILAYNIEADKLCKPTVQSIEHRLCGAVADSVVIKSSVFSVPSVITEVTLYHMTKRIDISYRIVLDRTPLREVLVSFPFCVDQPEFSFQGLGSTVRAFYDIVPGANTNQYACNHWCRVENNSIFCTLSMSEARITEFGGIHPTAVSQAHRQLSPAGFSEPYIKKSDIKNGHVISMLSYNNCRTNFAPTQEGEVIFRYAITSGERTSSEAFAESFACPPVLISEPLPPRGISLDRENLRISSFKPSEDKGGFILRIREFEGKDTHFGICFSGIKAGAMAVCDITEQELGRADPNNLFIRANGTLTLKVFSA